MKLNIEVSAGLFPSNVSKETLFVYPGVGRKDGDFRALESDGPGEEGIESLSPLISDSPRRDESRFRAGFKVGSLLRDCVGDIATDMMG